MRKAEPEINPLWIETERTIKDLSKPSQIMTITVFDTHASETYIP